MAASLTGQLETASPASASLLSAALPRSSSSSPSDTSSFVRPYVFGSSPTLTLSLTSGYAPHWTRREGVRELVQNWYDGCNGNLRSLNQRITASSPPSAASAPPALYGLRIDRASSPSHVLYSATAAHDSRPQLHLGSILHHAPSNTLTFHNNAVSLSRAILLLGHTSKRGSGGSGAGGGGADVGMVGSFGEGMKVGMLALLREGCKCWMGTRGEVWQFDFYHDHNYGETLLGVWTNDSESRRDNNNNDDDNKDKAAEEHREEVQVEVHTDESECQAEWLGLSEQQRQERVMVRAMLDQRKPTDTTTVLSGLSADDWTAFQQDFLFLSSTAPSSIVSTSLGSILLSSSHQHALFVKGFMVASFPNDLVYGVDLKDAKLDRDRKAVLQTSELHRLVGSIWAQAASAQPELILTKYYELLLHHSSSAESKNAEYYLTAQTIENVASTFFALHGHDSQPVLNSSGDDAVFISTQLSRRPVMVPAALYEILTRSARIQPVDELISQHQSRSAQQVALSSLSPQQLHCLQSAVRLVQTLAPLFTMEEVAVTAFSDEEGVWCKEGELAGGGGSSAGRAGKVLIDSRCLDIEKVHQRWGDCGLEDRRVQQGKGKGVKGLVTMAECSCREAAIAALVIKETRRVRWRNGAAAGGAAGGRTERRKGGDVIMEHIARGRESELLMVNMLERTARRAENERMRRQNLEEEKQLVLQHLQHREAGRQQPQQQAEEHKADAPAADNPARNEVHSEAESGNSEQKERAEGQQRDLRLLGLQHELELLRADLQRQQQLAAQHDVDSHTRERLLRGAIAELSGQSLDGVPDERLKELERLHVTALSELQRVREERRRKVAEAEEAGRKRSECGVCMSRAIDCVLLPCRHANVCFDCARKMDKCGVCRKRIDDRIQFFG